MRLWVVYITMNKLHMRNLWWKKLLLQSFCFFPQRDVYEISVCTVCAVMCTDVFKKALLFCCWKDQMQNFELRLWSSSETLNRWFCPRKPAKLANDPDNTSRKPPMTYETFDGFPFIHAVRDGQWPLEKIHGMNLRNASGMISSWFLDGNQKLILKYYKYNFL
jgi:hypothetical protein